MHAENSIVMSATADLIFRTASDLELWPDILSHYRWVRFLEKSPSRSVVVMAARRSGIPIQWTSELRVDSEKQEIHFHHLKAFTRGMHVVWTLHRHPEGTEVRIRHDLTPRIPIIGRFIAERIIGGFFITHVANQTLRQMKRYIETLNEA
jgi:aromatase